MTIATATSSSTGRRRTPARARALATRAGFLGPFYSAFALFFLLPIGFAVYESLLSQRRVGGVFGRPIEVFAGLSQFGAVFSDPQFWSGIRTVVLYVCVQAPLMATVGVALALLLDVTAPRLARLLRTSYFVPYAVSTVVGTILWGTLYTPGSSPLSEFHINIDLLSHSLVLPSIVNIGIWEWGGFNVVLMTTALTTIPTEIFDSARVDGASKWGLAWYIKLPLIRPTIVMSLVLTIIGTLQLFTEPQLMAQISDSIPSYYTPNMLAYSQLSSDNYSFAAAISVTLALVGLLLSFTFIRVTRRRTY
ncbi:MAG TPA: sugar ABC transporter permease [Acidimicrobiales bacterium]|nr:sugar ABC transporter permease [Acidimicrobiales bacterium]